jgi:hypothetical protein
MFVLSSLCDLRDLCVRLLKNKEKVHAKHAEYAKEIKGVQTDPLPNRLETRLIKAVVLRLSSYGSHKLGIDLWISLRSKTPGSESLHT